MMNPKLVKTLLILGANPKDLNCTGKTPLTCAYQLQKSYIGRKKVIKILKDYPSYLKMLAFCMAQHKRLGQDSTASILCQDIYRKIWEYLNPTGW